MPEHMQEFSPERWAIVKDVLSGDHNDQVSMKAAAQQAGISLATLKAWIRRSERQLPEDDPLIHEIAPFMQEVDELQAATLEDVMWQRAIEGVDHPVIHKGEVTDTYKKVDNRLLDRMISVRSERYRPKVQHEHRHRLDASDIYARLLAGRRLAEAEREKGRVIEGHAEVIDGVGLPVGAITPDQSDPEPDIEPPDDNFEPFDI